MCMTDQFLADKIIEDIDDFFCTEGSFSNKSFNKSITEITMNHLKNDLRESFSNWLVNKNPKQFVYNNKALINYVLKLSEIETNSIAKILIKKSNFMEFHTSAEDLLCAIYCGASDDIFESYIKKLSLNLNTINNYSIIMRFSKMKSHSFCDKEMKWIVQAVIHNMYRDNVLVLFDYFIPTLSFLLKYSDKGMEFYQDSFNKFLELPYPKHSWQGKRYATTITKAIRFAKNKQLRKNLIKTALLLNNNIVNSWISKHYPKYEKFITMA